MEFLKEFRREFAWAGLFWFVSVALWIHMEGMPNIYEAFGWVFFIGLWIAHIQGAAQGRRWLQEERRKAQEEK